MQEPQDGSYRPRRSSTASVVPVALPVAGVQVVHPLGREPATGHAFIIHQPNAPSGGRLSHVELEEFLRKGDGPEQQALLRLIGSLVDVPPFA